MPVEPDISIANAEAEAFARRLGLTWLSAEGTTAMREAMVTIARAGLVVQRVSSKFVQPAFVFSVAPQTQDSKPNRSKTN
jgi:hypothetical protein